MCFMEELIRFHGRKKSSEMRKDITSIIRFFLGEIVRVYGSGICLMGADSVSWERNLFHGGKITADPLRVYG